jgi:hypothetical protein
MPRPKITPDPKGMDRRQFIRHMALTGATATGALAAGLFLWEQKHFVPGFGEKSGISLPSFAGDLNSAQTQLAIAHGTDRIQTTRAALDALGGMQRFVQKGDVVMLKPNVAFDRPPALAATTHPDSLRAVAQLVLEAGARQVIVADNPINSPAGCFLKSGLEAVANELNLDLVLSGAKRLYRVSRWRAKSCATGRFSTAPSKRPTRLSGSLPARTTTSAAPP